MVGSFLPDEIYFYDAWLNDWVFLLSFLVLGLEAIRYLLKKKLTWGMVEDSITNFVTFLCGSRNYYRHHRPLKLKKDRVGRCSLESGNYRANIARLEVQKFRYLQDVNNLV